MTLQQLLDAIKREGRLEGDTGEDDLILSILNDLYTEATEQQKIPELKVIGFAFEIFGPAYSFDLPVDYLKLHRVTFIDEDGSGWSLDSADGIVEPAPNGYYGKPKQFEIVGQQLFIEPSDDLEVGDAVLLDYYKLPPFLDNLILEDDIIAPRLSPFLLRSALARLKVYHEKLDQAQFHLQDATKAAQGFAQENQAQSNAK